MARQRTLPLSAGSPCFFLNVTFDILVNQSRNKSLVGDSFLCRFALYADQVMRTQSYVKALIFYECVLALICSLGEKISADIAKRRRECISRSKHDRDAFPQVARLGQVS